MPRHLPATPRLVAILAIALLCPAFAATDPPEGPGDDDYELHRLFVDTLDQVERNYVKDVTRRELIEAAIRGVLRELDPYSNYIPPKDLGEFKDAVDSQFGGIGIQISTEKGFLEVVSPLPETPAQRAGILAGDRIVEIDGESTEGLDVHQAARRLKGEQGTEVTLTILHRGSTEREKVVITREVIQVRTVLGAHRSDDGRWDYLLDPDKKIGYIQVSAFSHKTAEELREALTELKKGDLRGLILDLRFNPGGLLRSAIEVSDLFVADGRIVSTKGKEGDSTERSWEAHKANTFDGFPMAVLVNRYSASAAEIVSACLQDHKRAVVVGERTWGKGSVQNVIPLEHGRSALKLTTANYYRPNGKSIHRFPGAEETDDWGVVPDKQFERKLNDREMLALMRYRNRRDVRRPMLPQGAEKSRAGDAPAEASEAAEPASDLPDPTADESREPGRSNGDASEQPDSEQFVDVQLQMALDYLNQSLARAE
jgi:carboxyl-terminal processing protease